MQFARYHALGNDYLVIQPEAVPEGLSPERVRRICHRNYGVGSDGILLGPFDSLCSDFRLEIYNPDGSRAEKSGNGLRIFARALLDRGLVSPAPFTVETEGGIVSCEVRPDGGSVRVAMGGVSFHSRDIPVAGEPREVLNETLAIDGEELTFCAATVGNPHCVVVSHRPTAVLAQRLGPAIETEARFPNRTNVQFMRVLDRGAIEIEIWERGAGYTLASGSSSTAAAAVAHRLGLCDADITVHMPGGRLHIRFDGDFTATMTGPVTKVCEGILSPEVFTFYCKI